MRLADFKFIVTYIHIYIYMYIYIATNSIVASFLSKVKTQAIIHKPNKLTSIAHISNASCTHKMKFFICDKTLVCDIYYTYRTMHLTKNINNYCDDNRHLSLLKNTTFIVSQKSFYKKQNSQFHDQCYYN